MFSNALVTDDMFLTRERRGRIWEILEDELEKGETPDSRADGDSYTNTTELDHGCFGNASHGGKA